MLRLLLTLFVAHIALTISTAQCDPDGIVPGVFCEDAPLACLEDACFTTGTVQDQGHSGFCGPNTLVHNPQYFLFVASSDTMQIDITINSCTSGVGLQAAIIDISNDTSGCGDWENSDVLACDPNFNGSTSLVVLGMTTGNMYLLLVDGSNSATCNYSITYTEGIASQPLGGELESITMDPQACPGDTTWSGTVSPVIDGAQGYIWTGLPGGTVISNTATLSSGTEGFDGIPLDAFPGFYTVCVVPFSSCETSNSPVCFNLQITGTDSVTLDPVTACPEEYENGDVVWEEMAIPEPGTYSQIVADGSGCAVFATREYLAYPDVEIGTLDTIICDDQFIYEGFIYSSSGTYTLFYQNASVNGCDSATFMTLAFVYADADLQPQCNGDVAQISSNVDMNAPGSAVVSYEWYDQIGNLVSTDANFSPDTGGLYYFQIDMEYEGTTCSYGPWSFAATDVWVNDCNFCGIEGLSATQGECDSLGQYPVIIDLQLNGASGQFTLSGNGEQYGIYSYLELPVTVGPFPGDVPMELTFTANDVLNPACIQAISVDTFMCETSGIFNLTDVRQLDIRYDDGRPFLLAPADDLQVYLHGINGELLHHSGPVFEGALIHLSEYVDQRGIIIVRLEGPDQMYIGKAVISS